MNHLKKKPFNQRAFVALMAVFTGALLPFSGLILHSLRGRGYFSGRHAWFILHTILGVIFLVLLCWHLYLNRRPFLHYLKTAPGDSLPLSREARWALIIVAVILVMVILSY